MRKDMGHTAVSATKASSVTLKMEPKGITVVLHLSTGKSMQRLVHV